MHGKSTALGELRRKPQKPLGEVAVCVHADVHVTARVSMNELRKYRDEERGVSGTRNVRGYADKQVRFRAFSRRKDFPVDYFQVQRNDAQQTEGDGEYKSPKHAGSSLGQAARA